ncbi:MAG: sodium:solute symporter family protein [Planctomycetaceae bacterium]|nr:sodium:solute symporter family protein [Planctomycetaceae bacterium]
MSSYPHTRWVITGIIVFFFVRLGIGYWASRRVNNAADFVVAGRGLPIYMTASSIMATWFAAETLMGASANGYKYGFQGVIFDPFGAVVCLLISGFFFIRLMRRARYLTVVDFFEKRFGKEFSLVSSIVQILAYLAWTSAQFVAGSIVCHSLLGWDPWMGVVLVGVIVTGYTTMGGMLADTLLDFIQMFFTAGGITAVFLCVLKEVGGIDGLLDHNGSVNVTEPFAMLPLAGEQGYLGYTGVLGWSYWISAWLTIGLGSVATQDLMQRSMSAHNEATSVWGSYFAAILYFTFGVMSPLVGIMMHKLQPGIPDEQIESLLLMASVEYLPLWMNVLFIAALTSAMMSTSDSAILAGASVVTENIFPLTGARLNDVQKLMWTRTMEAVIAVCCMALALAIQETYKLALMAWSILLVGMFAPFAFGMYSLKANRTGAIVSSVSGFAVWVACAVALYPTTYATNIPEGTEASWKLIQAALWDAVYIASTPAFAVSVVLMAVVSYATCKWDQPLPLTDVDGNPLPMKNRLGTTWIGDVFRDTPEMSPPG